MSSSSSPSLATNATSTSTPMSTAPARSPAKSVLNLPPGYHFLPTDAELVIHYLRPRLANARLPLPIFVNERILDHHPDALIEKYRNYGEGRWFFFTGRERKHVGGNRPNRTTPDNGHWNATGSVRPIRSAGGVLVGCRRTLVFYEASRSRKKKSQAAGLPPAAAEEEEEEEGQAKAKAKDGVKTEWTMYEYESLASEAEFEAIRTGNANKMDQLVLCTIQKKKHSQEGGEKKKSTKRKTKKKHSQEGGETKKKKSSKRKTKEEGLKLEAMPAAATGGNVEQGSRAGTGTTEGQDENHVQRALMEAAAAAAGPLPELLAYHAPAAGVDNFNNVGPNQNMPYYYLTNSLSPVPIHSQETLMAPARGDNHIVMHQENYYIINHSMNIRNSQPFPVQETPPQEFLPYLDTKMAAPRDWGNTMDHMLQNRFVNMTPSQAPPVTGTGTSSVWERSAELPGDKPNRPQKLEHVWQAQLPGRELDSPYDTSSSSFVPTPQQEMVMALSAREYNHTAMHQRNYYSNHSINMRNLQFHVQAALPQEELFAYSSTKMAAPLGGGGSIVDYHKLQNMIVNMAPAAEAHTSTGFFPSLSSSNYGHLSTTRMDHPGPSSVSLPSQQSHGAGSGTGIQGPLLNNQVNLSHQNFGAAASMVGYDQSVYHPRSIV